MVVKIHEFPGFIVDPDDTVVVVTVVFDFVVRVEPMVPLGQNESFGVFNFSLGFLFHNRAPRINSTTLWPYSTAVTIAYVIPMINDMPDAMSLMEPTFR